MSFSVANVYHDFQNLDPDKKVNFSIIDFFQKEEIEHFLEFFTRPYNPPVDVNYKLRWSSKQFDWPRRIVKGLDTKDAVLRWDLVKNEKYREDLWAGKLVISQFETVFGPRLPNDFVTKLMTPEPPSDASIISVNETMESLIGSTSFTQGNDCEITVVKIQFWYCEIVFINSFR